MKMRITFTLRKKCEWWFSGQQHWRQFSSGSWFLCGGHEKEGVRNQRQARLWCKFNDSWTSQPYSLVFGVLSVISRRWSLLSTPPHFDMQRHSLPLQELFSRKEWRFSQPTSQCSRPLRSLLCLLENTMVWIIGGPKCNWHIVIYSCR